MLTAQGCSHACVCLRAFLCMFVCLRGREQMLSQLQAWFSHCGYKQTCDSYYSALALAKTRLEEGWKDRQISDSASVDSSIIVRKSLGCWPLVQSIAWITRLKQWQLPKSEAKTFDGYFVSVYNITLMYVWCVLICTGYDPSLVTADTHLQCNVGTMFTLKLIKPKKYPQRDCYPN